MVKALSLAAWVMGGLAVAAVGAEKGRFDPFAGGKPASAPASGDVIANVEFVDTPITTIFRMVSDLTGWSIMMSPEVSKAPPKINIWIKNLTPDKVLDQVVALSGLVAQRQGTSIQVMTFEEYCRMFGVEKQVVPLEHAVASEVANILRPFVEEKGQSRILPDSGGNKVILLAPQPLMTSLAKLIKSVDVPRGAEEDTIRLIPLKHIEAAEILPELEKFLTQTAAGNTSKRGETAAPVMPTRTPTTMESAQGGGGAEAGDAYRLRLLAESGLNVIVLRGRLADVAKAVSLIEQLDVPRDKESVSYPLAYINAQEAYDTLRQLIPDPNSSSRSRMRIAMSRQNCRIVVEGSPKDQERIRRILAAIDKPIPPGTATIRVYRLENATAKEVATVLQALVNQTNETSETSSAIRREPLGKTEDGIQRVLSQQPDGAGASGASTAGQTLAQRPGASAGGTASNAGDALPDVEEIKPTVVESPETNAVVIRASAADHEQLAAVIRDLDRPREQVMLEVMLVAVQTTDTFDLGVELAAAGLTSGLRQIGFTNFGIGQPDSNNGGLRLRPTPPKGLNYAIFHSDDFALVLNALETVGNTRITSSPKLLVEDNAQSQISLVNQEPFEVTTQGESSTLTSFGGFVDAGTTLTVIPHLSKSAWLKLEYQVVFSSFGERLLENSPPPRTQNSAVGTVHIPADHTVVLGGLVTTRKSSTVKSVPFLSQIPLLGELGKDRSNEGTYNTLFIFIRPVLLRNRGFEDLVMLSRGDLRKAGLTDKGEPCNPLRPLPEIGTVKEEVQK
ncbi:MAG: secretin N-terminal domain-containing protein [Phycisphaerae bacterium]|jgi:general secretion pathway protein D